MSDAEIDKSNSPVWPTSGNAGGCRQSDAAPGEIEAISEAIRIKYAAVSLSALGKFSYPTGKEGAEALGYDAGAIGSAHAGLLESFCGVGNPFSLGEISPGESVLDFGCGAGFDLFVASRLVGVSGRVCGVDLTKDMVARAKENLASAGVMNYEVTTIDSGVIPYEDDSFDVVTSNGVINLCPGKLTCFSELYRILRPGGRIQFADVVVENELPAHLAGSPEAWSQWVGGAIPVRDQIRLMEDSGFRHVDFAGMTAFRTSPYTVGALFRARKGA